MGNIARATPGNPDEPLDGDPQSLLEQNDVDTRRHGGDRDRFWRLALSRQAGNRRQVPFVPAKIGDVIQAVSANGTLNPVVLVNVGTQVSGTVKKLHVDFNDRVKAGQILLELDPALLVAQVGQDQANLNSAKASLELAELNEARAHTLWQQDSIAKQEVDTAVQVRKSAQAQVDQATAQLAKDRTNLGYSVIRSPVAGVVVNRAVDLGQTVAASFQTPTLFQIAQDLRKMQIDSSFAEADIGNIKVGQPVQFTVDAFPDRTFSATVRQVRLNPTTQQNVVTYDVVVAVDNADQILMPGMTAYVNVIVSQRKGAVLVPNAALRFKPEGAQAVVKGEACRGKGRRDGRIGLRDRKGATAGNSAQARDFRWQIHRSSLR